MGIFFTFFHGLFPELVIASSRSTVIFGLDLAETGNLTHFQPLNLDLQNILVLKTAKIQQNQNSVTHKTTKMPLFENLQFLYSISRKM